MPPENSTDKTSVEERLLASIKLMDASQGCALLRIETDDPEGAVCGLASSDGIIAVVQNGKTMLPQFQFDMANGRIFDVVGAILNLRPACVSNLRLCYWLNRGHVDFGCAPTQRFGHEDAAIVAAFRRYIEPVRHG
ncbi:conserved hypothetical protein (plasmid) [Ketogulonicigenium vulgare Y25]|uniref:Uncharacterized protein n=1 Tax=Ketogulonicigenium vulgare (strain WSH-001) TaxID=759362 RepID=F9YBK6_KETVW|nr:hypothetical protein [Ketogulonicigenium vulgare]ADO44324.1 conserved hypothetical protein [Ketogulonicigenium vulgare Y25]AEM42758.1 hypothetical protein KVU_PB0080 [Ketogulonicigenium vulgare WSH-001]ALJ82797.1 hypothetical protein KVH_15970 [Ketogulonicigenium vulgare]